MVIYKNKVSIIGLGYVGLPLACAVAANDNYEVIGYDLSEEKVEYINKKECPIDDERCAEDLKTVCINATTNSEEIKGSDIFIICVPTPITSDYMPNLEPVKSAISTVASVMKKSALVVIESTVNPGVCDEVIIPLIEEKTDFKAGKDFDLAHCPERINPGDAVWNVYNIPRNVGATTPEACKKTADFYRDILDAEINEMPDLKTCEATKIIENTFRDINIAYVNELAKSFDLLGIDLSVVIKGASNKPFAFMPHYPSCGVGGHCIPVDPYYLIERAKKSGFTHSFLKNARLINNSMPKYTVDLLIKGLNENNRSLKDTKVALLGMSYKANVADLRESPSIKIHQILEKYKADIHVYDPFFPEMNKYNTLEEVVKECDAIILATNHDEFLEKITPAFLKKQGIKVVIDGKNVLDKEGIKAEEIYYKGIGR